MTDEMTLLAKRAVACKGWRWVPGMLAWRPDCPPVRLAAIEDAGNALQEHRWLPDLTDPATLGCLLALVREAWGASFHTHFDNWPDAEPVWLAHTGSRSCPDFRGDTEAEALVAALESVP